MNDHELATIPDTTKKIALCDMPITDMGVVALALRCQGLTRVNLNGTLVTDVGVVALALNCPNVTDLRLRDTRVTELSLITLARYSLNLISIDLNGTDVTDESKAKFLTKVPRAYIIQLPI